MTQSFHQGFLRDDTTGALVVSGGGSGLAQRATPEAYGAKGDVKYISDAAMSLSSAVLTSASAPFVLADVGKTIMVRGAGLTADGNTLTATIASFQSASQVTLSVAASVAVTANIATYGTDDTAAFKSALNAAVAAAQADGSYYAELTLSARGYMIAGAPTVGGATLGNAQIPLPVIPTTGQKLILAIKGPSTAGHVYHWKQQKPLLSGATLVSPLLGQTSDATYGLPSVIGGPTKMTALDATDGTGFSNILVHIDGVSVIMPRNPSYVGVDLVRCAQAYVESLTVVADANPDSGSAPAGTQLLTPTNSNGLGLRMPRFQNNDLNEVGSFACEGFYYGITMSDHFNAKRLALIYLNTAMFAQIGAGAEHGIFIHYASVEATTNGIEVAGNAGGKLPITIARLDIEVSGGVTVTDTNSVLTGEIHYAHNASTPPSRSGATNVRIVDDNRARGTFTAPAVPASTVAVADSAMPWRDALVVISGGTVTAIVVDGQTEYTSTAQDRVVLVPTGKTISITYSVAPTWKWTVL